MTGSAKPIIFLKCRRSKTMAFTSFNPSYGLSARRFQRIATAEIQFPLLPSGVNSGGLSLPLWPKKLLPL
jgi:hypothetical protein